MTTSARVPSKGLPRLRLAYSDFAFAPDGMAANSNPLRRCEPRQELGQIAFVFRRSDEASDGMRLARSLLRLPASS